MRYYVTAKVMYSAGNGNYPEDDFKTIVEAENASDAMAQARAELEAGGYIVNKIAAGKALNSFDRDEVEEEDV